MADRMPGKTRGSSIYFNLAKTKSLGCADELVL